MRRSPSAPSIVPSSIFYGWVVVVVALLMNIASSPTNAVIFSFFIVPMSDDLGWSRSALAWGLTFRLAVAGISSPFVGMLVDRIGARWLGTAAGLVAGSCLIGLAFTHDLWMFYALSAISGLSGFGGPAGQLLTSVPVAKWFQAKRGRALAIASVGMPLGTAVLIPIAQWIITTAGWRTAWAIFGVLLITLAVPACALFMRKDPESIGLQPDGARSIAGDTNKPSAQTTMATDQDWTTRQMFRNPTIWIILSAMGLAGLVIQGTLVYRVSFWRDVGVQPAMVAFGTAVDPAVVVVSGLLFGLLAERIHVRYLAGIWGLGISLSMVPMVFATGGAFPILAHNFLWGAFMGANITVNNLIWPNYYGRKFLGTIRGIVFPIAVGTSAISAPLFGMLLESSLNTRIVWSMTLVAFLVSGLLLLLAKPPRLPKNEHPSTPVAGLAKA